MELKFSESDILFWKDEYLRKCSKKQWVLEEKIMNEFVPEVRRSGFLTKDQLHEISIWKAPRSSVNTLKNEEEFVREITKFSFKTPNMQAAIESLTVLNGVSWPTASVILHFFHAEPFPILDFRALWSVQENVPKQYSYFFWNNFTLYCRTLINDSKLSMRDLDRALWRYSKENQV